MQIATGSGRARKWTLAVVLWAFGLATTTLLVGLWGRTVTGDRATLETSAQTTLTSEVVTRRVQDWLGEGLNAAAEVGGTEVDTALRSVLDTPAAQAAIDEIVGGLVDAALAQPGAATEIDLAGALTPLVPTVTAELEAAGVEVPEDTVSAAIDQTAALVLTTETTRGVSGVAAQARSFLTTVLVVGIAALVLFGSLAVALAEDRTAMVRTLAVRLAVSGGTFVVFLRVSAWATDPARGRSPLVAGGSVLLASNHLVLVMMTGAALAVAMVAGIAVRQRRRRAGPGAADDDTSSQPVLVTV